jgi:hypothetical protein
LPRGTLLFRDGTFASFNIVVQTNGTASRQGWQFSGLISDIQRQDEPDPFDRTSRVNGGKPENRVQDYRFLSKREKHRFAGLASPKFLSRPEADIS